jgi:hypothetical protein
MDLFFLTPNKYRSEMNFNGSESYSLKLDGKFYTKTKKKKEWKFLNNIDVKKQASFVNEYSMLVNNDQVKFLGIEDVDGVPCYKVELPLNKSNTEMDVATIKTSVSTINFYSIESGLLVMTEAITDSETDYVNNNKYLKDSKIKSKTTTLLSDYRSVHGILMPFKMTMNIVSDVSSSSTILEYSEISINQDIDKKEFEVKD